MKIIEDIDRRRKLMYSHANLIEFSETGTRAFIPKGVDAFSDADPGLAADAPGPEEISGCVRRRTKAFIREGWTLFCLKEEIIMRKRSTAGLFTAAAMALSLLAGCGASEASSAVSGSSAPETSSAASGSSASAAEAETETSENGVLRVGMECAYPPFNWTQMTSEVADGITAEPIYGTDTYAYGYDVAVAQMLARELGMDLEIHKVEWSSIGTSLDAGVYDAVIAGMGRTPEREMAYAFTEPYYYRHNCIVVKKGGDYENVTKLSDLADTGCRVTTQLGTGWVPLLEQIQGAELSGNYETTSECFMAVSNGVADVCVVDLPTAESAAMTNEDLKVITFDASDTFTDDEEMVNVCIATRKDDTELRDRLQEAMDALGWNNSEAMDQLMEETIPLQPAASV